MSVGVSGQNQASTGTSVSVTLSPASGSTLVVGAWSAHSSPVITDGTNTYTQQDARSYNGGFDFASLSYSQNITGGSLTITATANQSGPIAIWAVEVPSAKATGGLDGFAGAEVTGSTSTVTGPSVTTVAANATVLEFIAGGGNGAAAPNAATHGTLIDAVNGVFVVGGVSYQAAASAGSYSDTLTFPSQSFFDMVGYTVSVAPAAVTGYSLSSAYGSYALSGQPVAMAPSASILILLANSGTYNYIGAPAVSGYSLAAAAGSFAITGQAIGFSGITPYRLSAAAGSYAIAGVSASFSSSVIHLGQMPDLLGYLFDEALLILQQYKIYVPSALGYFSAFPYTLVFEPSNEPPSTVVAQSIPAGTLNIVANTPMTLTLSEFPMSVAAP